MSRQGQTCIPGTLSGNVHGHSQLVVHYLPQPLGGWACSHMDGLDPASVPRHLQVSNFAGDTAALHHKINTHLSQELGSRALKEDKSGAAVDASPPAVPCQPDEPVDK